MSALATTARRSAKRVIRIASSTAIRRAGLDVTEQVVGHSCLVVAPHPDDETFGCGSLIARMRSAGVTVHVVFLTGGGRSPKPHPMSTAELVQLRRDEATTALGILGVDPACIVHLGLADGALTDRCDEAASALTNLIHAIAPRQVLVTSASDRHPDHSAAAHATRNAVARCSNAPIMYEYPIWQRIPALSFAREAFRVSPSINRRPRLVSTRDFLARKKQAIAAYGSQLPHLPVGFVEDFLMPYECLIEVDSGRRNR